MPRAATTIFACAVSSYAGRVTTQAPAVISPPSMARPLAQGMSLHVIGLPRCNRRLSPPHEHRRSRPDPRGPQPREPTAQLRNLREERVALFRRCPLEERQRSLRLGLELHEQHLRDPVDLRHRRAIERGFPVRHGTAPESSAEQRLARAAATLASSRHVWRRGFFTARLRKAGNGASILGAPVAHRTSHSLGDCVKSHSPGGFFPASSPPTTHGGATGHGHDEFLAPCPQEYGQTPAGPRHARLIYSHFTYI